MKYSINNINENWKCTFLVGLMEFQYISLYDITHNVRSELILAKHSRSTHAEVCGAGPALKRYQVNVNLLYLHNCTLSSLYLYLLQFIVTGAFAIAAGKKTSKCLVSLRCVHL